LLFLVCLYFSGSYLHAQQDIVFFTIFPYDGNNLPFDPSKIVYGSTPEEVCAKRTSAEILGPMGFLANPQGPVTFIGLLPGGSCGFQWLNLVNGPPGVVVTVPEFSAQGATCEQIRFSVGCDLCGCSAGGGSGGGGGGSDGTWCGNPVNAGTGNKLQSETDLTAAGANSVRLVRYYNSGRPALDRALGGYWLHTYTRRILTNAAANRATYYRSDGKQLVFTLQSGIWTGDADVADRLTELRDPNLGRNGWKLRLAGTEDTEGYDASGRLMSIQARSGRTQRLTYTDGTDGTVSGDGGFVLDAAGNATTAVLPIGILLRVTDHFGRTLTFGYDSLSRIVKVTDPANGAFLYGYSAPTSLANLTSVTFPDGRQRLYQYKGWRRTDSRSRHGCTRSSQPTGPFRATTMRAAISICPKAPRSPSARC